MINLVLKLTIWAGVAFMLYHVHQWYQVYSYFSDPGYGMDVFIYANCMVVVGVFYKLTRGK